MSSTSVKVGRAVKEGFDFTRDSVCQDIASRAAAGEFTGLTHETLRKIVDVVKSSHDVSSSRAMRMIDKAIESDAPVNPQSAKKKK